MTRLRISTSIYFMLAATLGVACVASIILMRRCSEIQSNFAAIQAGEVQQALDARLIQVTFKKQVQEWKDTLLRGENADDLEKYSNNFHNRAADVQELTAAALTKVTNPDTREVLSQFRQEHAAMLVRYDAALEHFRETKDAHAADHEVRGIDRAPTDLIDKAVALLSKQAKEKVEQENASTGRKQIWLALGLLVAGVTLAFGSWRLVREITGPLAPLNQAAHSIAKYGDLNQEIHVEREDELGELGRSFAEVLSYLKEMAAVSEAIAQGDLLVEVEPRSERDTLGHAFQSMIQGLREIVGSVRDSAAQVAAGSSQVADASEDSAKASVQASAAIDDVTSTMHEMSMNVQNMVKNTQVQASSVGETSASIDQMVASIQRVADTVKVLLDISSRSGSEVTTGIATMQKTTKGLNRINGAIGSSAGVIRSLGARADNIGKIVEVIDDISEQTNLLALNAAIEAARAGEHGLGFAVVADEVRKLAEKSATSTKEIGELISSIQTEARHAVDDMEKSTAIVNEGLQLGEELSVALNKIASVVSEVNRFAKEIGAATNEQSAGSTQIGTATVRLNEITHEISSAVEEQAGGTQAVVRAMERMREMVQHQTSGTAELAASSEQMSRMAANLLETVKRFAIDDGRRQIELSGVRRTRALTAK